MWRKRTSNLGRRQLKRRLHEAHRNGNHLVSRSIPSGLRGTHESDTSTSDSRNLLHRVVLDHNNKLESKIEDFEDTDIIVNRTSLGDQNVLQLQLREWAISNNISLTAATALLKILREKPNWKNLPADARTLLHTPRRTNTRVVEPGQYMHLGLKDQLIKQLTLRSGLPQILELQFNIDGLPTTKSASKELWPIQAKVINIPSLPPIVVGMYFGCKKPKDANCFLSVFVEEIHDLILNGFSILETRCSIKILNFICDIPAKSFVKYTKGHNGYSSCSHCEIEGEWLGTGVSYNGKAGVLRDNVSFRNHTDNDHHKGTSILENLELDMVRQFPSDYMHLICLGVTRKLLVLWMKGKDKRYKLSLKQIIDISGRLLLLRSFIPKEFARKPRGLNEIDLAGDNWEQYPAEIMMNCDSYNEANRKAVRALDTSDLNSEPEKKRKRLPKRPYSPSRQSSSCESDSDLDTNSARKSLKPTSSSFSLPKPPTLKNTKPSLSSIVLAKKSAPPPAVESDEELPDIDNSPSGTNQRKQGPFNTDFSTPPPRLCFKPNAEQARNFSRETTPSSSHRLPGQSAPTRALAYENNSLHSTTFVPASALVSINSNLEQINGLLTTISHRLRRIEEGSNKPGSTSLESTTFGFPMSDLQQLRNFNDTYNEDPELKSSLRSFLSSFGGKTITTCTTRILHEILTDKLANQLSWSGRTKIGLSTFPFHTAIIDAVLVNFRGSSATRNAVEEIIKNWLSHAVERLSRSNRQAASLHEQH